MLYKPINHLINVRGVLARYHEAAYFSISKRLESPVQTMEKTNIRINVKKSKTLFLCFRIIKAYISSVKASLDRAPGLSILLPRTRSGIPLSDVLLNKSWSSLFDTLRLSGSAASTTYLESESNCGKSQEPTKTSEEENKKKSLDSYTIAETERQ